MSEPSVIDREKVARLMLRHGIATGHGDTIDDLLATLSVALDEMRATTISNDAFNLAETLVNHQWGVSVPRLAQALESYRAAGLRLTLDILHQEGSLGNSERRIRKLLPPKRGTLGIDPL